VILDILDKETLISKGTSLSVDLTCTLTIKAKHQLEGVMDSLMGLFGVKSEFTTLHRDRVLWAPDEYCQQQHQAFHFSFVSPGALPSSFTFINESLHFEIRYSLQCYLHGKDVLAVKVGR
jgi:hypothetical protein